MAFIIENEEEVGIPAPKLEAADPALKEEDQAAYDLAFQQMELSYNMEKTEHMKEMKKYILEKQLLAGYLIGKLHHPLPFQLLRTDRQTDGRSSTSLVTMAL